MSSIFDVELCGDDHFRIWLKSLDVNPDDVRRMLALQVRYETEDPSIAESSNLVAGSAIRKYLSEKGL